MFSLLSKTGFMDMILQLSLWLNARGHSSFELIKTLLHTLGTEMVFLLLPVFRTVQKMLILIIITVFIKPSCSLFYLTFIRTPQMRQKRHDYLCFKDEELEVSEFINDFPEVIKQVIAPDLWSSSPSSLSSTQKFPRKKSGRKNILSICRDWFALPLHCRFPIHFKQIPHKAEFII